MCFRPNGATASRRRRSARGQQAPTLPPVAMLDLSKPGERQAHEFLVRATSGRARMWELLNLGREGAELLCVVRWRYPESAGQHFSLAEVSLTEIAVRWRYFASREAARAEMDLRRTASATSQGSA